MPGETPAGAKESVEKTSGPRNIKSVLASNEGRSAMIKALDEWEAYESGDWKKYNKKFAKALNVENSRERIKELQTLAGITNPDGKIGPKSAFAIAEYLKLKNKPSDFSRKSTRKQLSEIRKQVEIDQMHTNKEALYTNFVNMMAEYTPEGQSGPVPDKDLFMNRIDEVIDYSRGDIDVNSIEGWETAFESAGFTQSEMNLMAIPRPEDRMSIQPEPEDYTKEESVTDTFKNDELIAKNSTEKNESEDTDRA